jgi:NADH-quinone oxidoreductase subunit N
MIVLIFSMSGIPPFAGFYTKFDIFYVLYYSLEVLILFFVLLLTVISFFYYLRILKTIYFDNFNVNIKKYDDLKIESFS